MELDNLLNEVTIRKIKSHYRSGADDLGKEFFAPCLLGCSEYRRAVGFFSSSALITWADALPRLISPGTIHIKLLISPQLSSDDLEVLKNATDPSEKARLRQELVDRILLQAIEFAQDPHTSKSKQLRLSLLTWMIANDQLELRFAFPRHIDQTGMFHEKIGLFIFPNGERIAFTGSANESISGHSHNYESIDVYRSWVDADKERINIKSRQFDEAWEGRAFGLDTLQLSSSALDRVKVTAPTAIPDLNEALTTHDDNLTAESNKWRHQEEAVERFLEVGNGILEMATGTGKTKTALKILSTLVSSSKVSSAVISTDGTDLLDQWRKEVDRWSIHQDHPFRVFRHYGSYHELNGYAIKPQGAVIIISRGALPNLLKQLPKDTRRDFIIIHDEVHGLGSPGNQTSLDGEHQHFGYRLGLSATPEREYDEEGTAFIEAEIGSVVFQFGLKEAIERGILCEFDYVPLSYELTEEDRARLHNVHLMKAARAHAGRPMTQAEVWTEIAKVYKTAEAKPYIFEQFLPGNADVLKATIVFVETKEYGSRILPMIHKYTHKYRTYYGDDERSNLVDFARGRIDCLITCHRISQGIDIHNLRNVILFSSARSKLETIQRIGRCLRYDPSNPDKRAKVIDFVRPQDDSSEIPNADQERFEWLTDISTSRRRG